MILIGFIQFAKNIFTFFPFLFSLFSFPFSLFPFRILAANGMFLFIEQVCEKYENKLSGNMVIFKRTFQHGATIVRIYKIQMDKVTSSSYTYSLDPLVAQAEST